MDSNLRIIAKSMSWQLMGLMVMSFVGYLFTGSLSAGGGIAVTGAVIGFVTYGVHEKIWALVGWGRA